MAISVQSLVNCQREFYRKIGKVDTDLLQEHFDALGVSGTIRFGKKTNGIGLTWDPLYDTYWFEDPEKELLFVLKYGK